MIIVLLKQKICTTNIWPFMSLTKILKEFADPENAIISQLLKPTGTDERIVAFEIRFEKPLVVEVYEERKKSSKYVKVTKIDSQAIFDAIKKALNLPKMTFCEQHSIQYPDDSYIWKPLRGSKSAIVKMDELDKAGRYLAVINSVVITPSAGPWTARSSALTLECREISIHFIDFSHGKRKIERLVEF